MTLSARLNWRNWIRVARAQTSHAVLGPRHIYILPTRYGLLYASVLLAMLVGSINYTLSLGFVLTFLLAGMGVVAMLHTWRNLADLQVVLRRAEPVFAGEDAVFEVAAIEDRQRARYAVAANFDAAVPVYADIAAGSETTLRLALPARQRGWLPAPRITFSTEFPLLLFHAWSCVEFPAGPYARCLVYPRPAPYGMPVPSSSDQGAAGALDQTRGDEDFAGHRSYQLGDSPKRVDWKASSREQGLLTKQFLGEAQTSLWLDWTATPGTDSEQRISQLTRWVIDAHAARQSYGLRLPRQTFAPEAGEAHYRRCLQALALMDS